MGSLMEVDESTGLLANTDDAPFDSDDEFSEFTRESLKHTTILHVS